MEQRTSEVKPVSKGLAKQIGRMFEDFATGYPGGSARMELAKGHPDIKGRVERFFDELAAEHEMMLPFEQRPPFMTIRIGTFKNVEDLRRALKDGKCNVSDYADDLLGRMTLVTEPMTIDLYRASNAELGLTQGGTVAQSFEAIAKRGGEKLPAEAGPQYRLQNTDQKLGEWELMYMDPIPDRDGYPRVFGVGRDEGGLWLRGSTASPGGFYDADGVWVFGRKRPVGA